MKSPTKVLIQLLLTSFLLFSHSSIKAQIGINTEFPDAASILDINSNDKGLLVPRISLITSTSIEPITGGSPEGLLVYNTNTELGKGFYFWSGVQWISLDNDWKTTGNAQDEVKFLGTTDESDLIFKTHNEEAMRINSSGQLLVGISSPNSLTSGNLLQVAGDIEIGGGNNRYDSVSENIQISAKSEIWNINVKNAALPNESHFYIGTGKGANDAGLMIANNGYIKAGKSGDVKPLSDFHIANDQHNKATTLRLDNTSSIYNIPHTSYELWDGNTFLKGFFRHNNKSNILDIGHNQGNGTFNFYSGNGSASSNPSAIAMILDNQGDVKVVNNLKVDGNLSVTGTISKAGGTFKIDHPLDPENKYLYHSFVESPDMMNIYNGNVITDASGTAIVKMPKYFNALNVDFRYQLTSIGSFSKVMISEEITDGTFVIKSEVPNVKISWQVTGIRNDAYAQKNRVKVEVEKEEHLKGTYLFPSGFKKNQ
ncbi:hypothetical protein [Ulvibacter antarcticus]|uniref:Uncharacterized protein n=1 Tax=Ulvibacter antarcticus TaxID=442714 RepID=A0A3L9YBD0_9FLAO|nr:hypothetical protein [Ulvibacter antarcticus]RMA57664.1 hypothetical protein BXY75_2468 [Ulvibacter antarcticus]